jgi:Bacterial Ig domain/Beta-propeller repeat
MARRVPGIEIRRSNLMARLCVRATLGTVLVVLLLVAAPALGASVSAPGGWGDIPLHFEENQGQAPTGVRFQARAPGYGVALGDDRATLTFGRSPGRVDLVLVGARAPLAVAGETRLPGKAHVFSGRNPRHWIRDIPLYGRVVYREPYPGIDLVYHGAGRRLEYDFVVAPGADPSLIELRLEGADRLTLEAGGDLIVGQAGAELRIHRPVAYQDVDGQRVTVEAALDLRGDRIGFTLGAWDRTRPLVIDPVVSYATYIGGAVADSAVAVAVDGTGHAYIAGVTGAFASFHDSFVTKLSPDGRTIVYQTSLLGDSNVAAAIAVDATGQAYVAGTVIADQLTGTRFPVTANALQPRYAGSCDGFGELSRGDAFVVRLAADGTLNYSSFLGGVCADEANGIGVDAAGNVYVAGYTDEPTSFPTRGTLHATPGRGGRFAFVTRMTADFGGYTYSTLLGGTRGSSGAPALQVGTAMAVDAGGNVYVTGTTDAMDFPTTAGAFRRAATGGADMFVSKLAPDGRLLFATYVGNAGTPFGLALDPAGNSYVGGSVGTGGTFPAGGLRMGTNAARAFVAKVSADGSRLLYGTLLGGDRPTRGFAVSVDDAGQAYLAGDTFATNFPAIDSPQPCHVLTNNLQVTEAWVAKLSTDGSWLHYAACLGGANDDSAAGLAVDDTGAAYVVGSTRSFDFPTRNAAIPTRPSGSENFFDGFAAKLEPFTAPTNPTPTLGVAITGPAAGATLRGTAWVDVWVSGAAAGASTFTLLVGDQTVAVDVITGVHATIPWDTRWTADGPRTLTARVRDSAGHQGSVTRAFTLANGPAPGPVAPPPLPPVTVQFVTPGADGQIVRDSLEVSAVMQGVSGPPIEHVLMIDGRIATIVRGVADGLFHTWDLPAVLNGTHTLTYTATDGAGRTATATRTVVVDNTEPAASELVADIATPAQGATVTGTIEIRASASGAASTPIQLVITLDGFLLAQASGPGTSLVHALDTTRIADGLHVIALRIQDGTGRSATTARRIRIANGGAPPPPPPPPGPGASFTSPAEGATVSGTTTVGMLATGASGTISFRLSIDGALVFNTSGTASTASFAWNTPSVTDGAHTLSLTVQDGAGRTATATRSVTVSNGGPPPPPPGTIRVFVTQPGSDGATVSGTVWFTIWIENAAAGSRTFTLTAGAGTPVTSSSTSNGPISMAWDSRTVADGTQTVTVGVRDAAGNTGSAQRRLNVQNGGTPPPPGPLGASFTSPADGATVSGTVTVGMSATGASGTPITFTLTVDGGQVFSVSGATSTASFSWNTTGVGDGAHTLGLTVRDGAGRTATATRSVTVANGTPPPGGTIRVFITQPGSDGATVAGTVWFTVWIENAAAGSKTYTLSAAGGTPVTTTTTSNGPVSLAWDSRPVANGSRAITITVRDAAGATGSATRTVNVAN